MSSIMPITCFMEMDKGYTDIGYIHNVQLYNYISEQNEKLQNTLTKKQRNKNWSIVEDRQML